MDNDDIIREQYEKATNNKTAVEGRVVELKEMDALDVKLTENATFWIIAFRLP